MESEVEGSHNQVPPTSRRLLVSISGLDGSGKSSNADALWESLSQRGFHVARAWAGYDAELSLPFIALVRLLGYTRRTKIRGLPFFRREVWRNAAISRLWPLVLALDFVPHAFISVVLPLQKGRIVICDRYVYDLVAELTQESTLGPRAKKTFLNFLPRPDIAFLIDVDEDVAWKRIMVPGRARTQPFYDLSTRRKIYLQLATEKGMIVLNGADDPVRNRQEILSRTLSVLEEPVTPRS